MPQSGGHRRPLTIRSQKHLQTKLWGGGGAHPQGREPLSEADSLMKKTLMVFAFERSFFSEEQETQNQKAAYRTSSSAFLPFQPQMAVCLVSRLSHSENSVCLVEKKAPPHLSQAALEVPIALASTSASSVSSPLGSNPMGLLTLVFSPRFRNTNVSFSTTQYHCHFVRTLRKIIQKCKKVMWGKR